nr:hypothetical protein [Tanacetum cinerariifolium]
MKINIAKAYETMDWNFLEKAITNFGFHERIVWIMVCVSTARFTINLNGERKSYLLVEEQNANFMFHMGCKELELTHLCFADDLLVVSHGDVESVRIIRDTMMEFSNISGLILDMEKIGKLLVKYLGVPLITKRLSSKEYRQLIDKVKNRVDDWKGRTIVKDNDKILKVFLWCKGEIKRGKAKVAWKTIWHMLKEKLKEKELSDTWDTLVDQYTSGVCNNSIGSILIRIMLASAVYHVWKERNTILFTVKKSSYVEKIALNYNVKMNFKDKLQEAGLGRDLVNYVWVYKWSNLDGCTISEDVATGWYLEVKWLRNVAMTCIAPHLG